jgi:hypothetical protein
LTTRAWSFVIDETDRIVQVGDEMPGGMEPFLGHPLWEYLPHGQAVFGPLFEEARATGHEVETVVYYAGGTVGVRIVPSGKKSLVVYATRRIELDVRTLGTLSASLRVIEQELDARAPARPDRRALGSQQALP